jgi:hypothetical protein
MSASRNNWAAASSLLASCLAVASMSCILEALLREHAGGGLSEHEARHLAAIALAAIEGAYQLSVSARGVMPTGYAAKALVELVDSRLGNLPG